jgi:hypothetical protein
MNSPWTLPKLHIDSQPPKLPRSKRANDYNGLYQIEFGRRTIHSVSKASAGLQSIPVRDNINTETRHEKDKRDALRRGGI